MPIFEYHCGQCGKEFEQLVINRSEPVACPDCHGQDVKKKFSVFGMKSGGAFVLLPYATRPGGCNRRHAGN